MSGPHWVPWLWNIEMVMCTVGLETLQVGLLTALGGSVLPGSRRHFIELDVGWILSGRGGLGHSAALLRP